MFPCGAFVFLHFEQNIYCSVLVPQNFPCPENFLVAQLHSGIILFAKWSILIVWQCSESCLSWWLLSNLYKDLMLCTISDTFRIWNIQNCLFRYILAYSSMFMHNDAFLRLIQVYSAPCLTLTYLQPCDFPSPGVFRTGGIFKTLWSFDQLYSEPFIMLAYVNKQVWLDVQCH